MDEKAANIERMAKEAGFGYFDLISPSLRSMDPRYAKFAALVADDLAKHVTNLGNAALSRQSQTLIVGAMAAAIRAKYPMPKEPG